MPGHTVGESFIQKTIESIQTLEQLIEQHDAIFLLTDSRESRWLPTLLGACHNKVRFHKTIQILFRLNIFTIN